MKGKARMAEPGFASALYYRISDDAAAGRAAVEWALGPDRDLRQVALVFDWCQPLLSEQQAGALALKLRRGIEGVPQGGSVSEARSRALAAIALAGHVPEVPERELQRLVQQWWGEHGRNAVLSDEPYALVELLHAVRDNLNTDLRESFRACYKDFPLQRLLGYYPLRYETSQGVYRVPARKGFKEPDWKAAELSRAADLALVAYDSNAQESQFLQGWLMHDPFLMRSAAGIPYEFLWANPYHPGLSYQNAPLVLYSGPLGRLLLRSSWDDDAQWAGCFDGELQVFKGGDLKITDGAVIGNVEIVRTAPRFKIDGDKVRRLFVFGLAPNQRQLVEIGGQKRELTSDAGGILEVECPAKSDLTVRIK
jgi:hypothetical protein